MSLVASRISVRYPGADRLSLQQVSLRLDPGELVSVVGPNGSGKSTLQRALLGLVRLESGRVDLDSKPLPRWLRPDLASRVGALPQREEPAWPVTVQQAVAMGRWLRLPVFADLAQPDRQAIDQALLRTDLMRLADRRIDTLSGGEWQRVRVARALAVEPAFLLLDEPTAALDLSHQMELIELLRSLADEGLGVLVITHDLDLAIRFSDRIVLLEEGRVVGDGAPSTLLTPDLVATVFGWPVTIETGEDGTPRVIPRRRNSSSPVVTRGSL